MNRIIVSIFGYKSCYVALFKIIVLVGFVGLFEIVGLVGLFEIVGLVGAVWGDWAVWGWLG